MVTYTIIRPTKKMLYVSFESELPAGVSLTGAAATEVTDRNLTVSNPAVLGADTYVSGRLVPSGKGVEFLVDSGTANSGRAVIEATGNWNVDAAAMKAVKRVELEVK